MESVSALPYGTVVVLDNDISLARCPKLQDRKEALLNYWRSVIKKHSTVSAIVEDIIERNDEELFLSLILDCSSLPQVVEAAQSDSTVLPLLMKEVLLSKVKLFQNIFRSQTSGPTPCSGLD